MEVNDFIQHFHNLDGITIGEKRKSLFLLLKNIPSDHSSLITSLTPKTYLEEFFHLEVLIRLQSLPHLIEILKSEKEYLAAKLLKNKWFCQKLASILDEDSSNFVNTVLPFTTFVIRMRIIAKLATYGTKLDKLYDEIYNRYGLYVASKLLVGCSESKIRSVLEKGEVKLSHRDLKLLYTKDPILFLEYSKQYNRCIDESVFNFIVRRDNAVFFEILGAKIGKRLTRKFLKTHKNKLITCAKTFDKAIHLRTVYKTLNQEDFKQFFFNCFPKDIENLRFGLSDIRNLVKTKYYRFLFEGVEKVYNKSLYDFPDVVDENLMDIMDLEERQKWISIKKQNGTPEADLIKYMKTSDSIPLIKRKIDVTSTITTREELLCLLVTTCRINQDFDALAEVIEYVSNRHRNDNESTLRNFLYELERSFELEKLGERHWNSIIKISNILDSRGHKSYFGYDFSLKYVEFLFANNKLTDERILFLLKLSEGLNNWEYKLTDKKLKKVLLLKMIEFLPKVIEETKKGEVYLDDLLVMSWIFDWNKKNKDKVSLSDFPRLEESFRKALQEAARGDNQERRLISLKDRLREIICTKESSELRDLSLKNYFLLDHRFFDEATDFFLVKFEPGLVHENFDKFFDHVLNSYFPNIQLLDLLKKYSHFSFAERTVKHVTEKIKSEDTWGMKFVILAVLMQTEEYLQLTSQFYPTVDKLSQENDEEWKTRCTADSIARSFKYSQGPVLPEIIKYCKRDFLGCALESLYYQFYHTPENKLSAFITELSSKAVSVRKHAIFLTCNVGNVQDTQNLFKKYIESERNISVQKHLFTAALKYFVKNPTEEFWECLKLCMTNLDKDDNESFESLVRIDQIPEKFQTRHVIFVWEMLKKSENLAPKKMDLLISIPSGIFKDFPLHFLVEIIREHFLKDDCAINNFVISSIFYTSYTSDIMDVVFDTLNKIKTFNQEKNIRQMVIRFVRNIVSNMECDEKNLEILRLFSDRWHSLFGIAEAVQEHLKISFALRHLESKKDLLGFSNTIPELLNSLVPKFGIVIIDAFASELQISLRAFLGCFGELSEDFYKFCLHLLKNNNDLTIYLLIIKLLPNKEPVNNKAKEVFSEIIGTLKQVPDESIQMLMNFYLTNMD